MAGFAAKLHLPFAQWPDPDKLLWQQAIDDGDPFSAGAAAHLSPASQTRYFVGWRRFLGFLAIAEPEALQRSAADRLTPERVKHFARHLAETCTPASVATCVEATYHAGRVMMPNIDFGWFKAMKTRLLRAVPPTGNTRPEITSLQIWDLGLALLDEVRPRLGSNLRLCDAVKYRDGLILSLTAFMPNRPKNVTELDLERHLQFGEAMNTILIDKTQTKTGIAIEFEIASALLPYVEDYLKHVRPRIDPTGGSTALWVSRKRRRLSYSALRDLFARHSKQRLGIHLRPHDVRAAGSTTWAIHRPDQIGVAQELLSHQDIRTTITYYNRARGIQASRNHAQLLKKLKRGR